MTNLFVQIFNRLSSFLSGYGLRRRFRIVNHIFLFLKSKITPSKIDLDGHTIYLDRGDSLGLSSKGIYEPIETKLIQNLVKPGDVVIDVGANIGYFTLQFARLVGKDGHVIAFEPEIGSFGLLEKNIRTNKYKNVEVHQLAVSDKNGELNLYVDNLGNLDHQIFNSTKYRSVQTVRCIALDEFLENQKRIDLIKMDIQGAEGKAINGMRTIFISHPELILLTEYWPLGFELSGSNQSDFFDLLEQYGYEIYDIQSKSLFQEKMTLEILRKKYPIEYHIHTNLLCIKNSTLHKRKLI